LAKSAAAILYVGPDQLMPLTSILGAILGVLLLFWNWVARLARRVFSAVMRRNRTGERQPAD
jgi:hypothetical protein